MGNNEAKTSLISRIFRAIAGLAALVAAGCAALASYSLYAHFSPFWNDDKFTVQFRGRDERCPEDAPFGLHAHNGTAQIVDRTLIGIAVSEPGHSSILKSEDIGGDLLINSMADADWCFDLELPDRRQLPEVSSVAITLSKAYFRYQGEGDFNDWHHGVISRGPEVVIQQLIPSIESPCSNIHREDTEETLFEYACTHNETRTLWSGQQVPPLEACLYAGKMKLANDEKSAAADLFEKGCSHNDRVACFCLSEAQLMRGQIKKACRTYKLLLTDASESCKPKKGSTSVPTVCTYRELIESRVQATCDSNGAG